MTGTLQQVLDLLDGVTGGSNGQYSAICPLHDDRLRVMAIVVRFMRCRSIGHQASRLSRRISTLDRALETLTGTGRVTWPRYFKSWSSIRSGVYGRVPDGTSP